MDGAPKPYRGIDAVFRELGACVDRQWRAQGYAPAAFAAVAAEALEAMNCAQAVDPAEVLGLVASGDHIANQVDIARNPAQPPVTVFSNPRFFVHVYTWMDATTALHSHSWSGAFQVLHGSSLSSRYAFRLAGEDYRGIAHGELSYQGSKRLTRGTVERVEAGRGYVHSLFHLERPSMTIVVRTSGTLGPQGNARYIEPGLELHASVEPAFAPARQALEALYALDREAFWGRARLLLESGDLEHVFLTCVTLERLCRAERDRVKALYCPLLDSRFSGPIAELFPQAIANWNRQETLCRRRVSVKTPAALALMGVLAQVPSAATAEGLATVFGQAGPRAGLKRAFRELHEAAVVRLGPSPEVAEQLGALAADVLAGNRDWPPSGTSDHMLLTALKQDRYFGPLLGTDVRQQPSAQRR